MGFEITTGVQSPPIKCVCYGVEGVGKTTFASKWPKAVFIDVEGGTAHYDVARYPQPNDWDMLLAEIESASTDPNVGTLVIDTADAAETLCIEKVLQDNNQAGLETFGYGKGYTFLAEEFSKMMKALDKCIECGKHVLVLSHAQIKKFEQPDEMGAYDRWELKLQRKCAPIVKEWADLLLFANFKTDVMKGEDGKYRTTGGKKRRMYASHTAAYDAKNRLGLPDEMPFEFDAIKDALPDTPKKSKRNKEHTEEEAPPLKFEEVTPPEVLQLIQLMADYQVKDRELMAAVGANGRHPYTADTPIADYPIDFIREVIIPNWEAIVSGIRNSDVPFN